MKYMKKIVWLQICIKSIKMFIKLKTKKAHKIKEQNDKETKSYKEGVVAQ